MTDALTITTGQAAFDKLLADLQVMARGIVASPKGVLDHAGSAEGRALLRSMKRNLKAQAKTLSTTARELETAIKAIDRALGAKQFKVRA